MKNGLWAPNKKEMMSMILALEQRLLTLHMFLDAMSAEFGKYLLFKKDTDKFNKFKKKYEEKEDKKNGWCI